ncbi:hypothetical protein JCGZ_08627 [Jatropha curcas]|uniref:Uncharacterized protein n=1 Tax=Jatropha curcas TaxID=180498 RepID=A0A067KPN5_JATCU|nr:hypothetical protein JCGZ_08627 [Jatropha curcas]
MGSQVSSSSYSPTSDFERSMNASYPTPSTRQFEQEQDPLSPLRLETGHWTAVPEVPDLLSKACSWCEGTIFLVGQLHGALTKALTSENFLEDQV